MIDHMIMLEGLLIITP